MVTSPERMRQERSLVLDKMASLAAVASVLCKPNAGDARGERESWHKTSQSNKQTNPISHKHQKCQILLETKKVARSWGGMMASGES
jgi:hypothetical protein